MSDEIKVNPEDNKNLAYLSDGNVIDLDNPEEAKKTYNESLTANEPKIISFKYKGDMATGFVLPNRGPAAVSYLSDVRDYNDYTANIYKQIELSRKLYIWEGIVGTVVDMLCDFSAVTIKVDKIKNKKAKEIVDFFIEQVNRAMNNITTGSKALSRMCAYNYFVDGNVFLYNKWSKVKYSNSPDIAKVPMLITPINPLIIEIPQESVNFGNKKIYLNMEQYKNTSFTSRKKTGKAEDVTEIPLKFQRELKSGKDKIQLDDESVYHIKRRGTSFGAWGVPYLTKVFSSVASKRRLRALDDGTTDGMINMITIVKVGDPKNPATWQPSRLQKMASLLSSPQPSLTLVWAYDVDILRVGPQGEVLNFDKKYDQVDKDIVTSLGVPVSLLTGQGERAGDIWVSLLMFLETVAAFRDEYIEYMSTMIDRILIENGYENENPSIKAISPKLRKDDIKNYVFGLYDRGLITKETTLEESGYDFDAELQGKKDEDTDEITNLFSRPDLPFSPKQPSPNIEKPKTLDREQTRHEEKIKEVRTEASIEEVCNKIHNFTTKSISLVNIHGSAYATNIFLEKVNSIFDIFGFSTNGYVKINQLLDYSYNSDSINTVVSMRKIERDIISYIIKNSRIKNGGI